MRRAHVGQHEFAWRTYVRAPDPYRVNSFANGMYCVRAAVLVKGRTCDPKQRLCMAVAIKSIIRILSALVSAVSSMR